MPKIVEKHGPVYFPEVIPAGTYPGQTTDNQQMSVGNIVAVRENMPDELVTQILDSHLEGPRRAGAGPRRSARLHPGAAEDRRRRRALAPRRGSVLEGPGRAACLRRPPRRGPRGDPDGPVGTALPPEIAPGALDEATTARVEQLIEEEEGAQNRFTGLLGWLATGVALAMALFHLWAAWDIVPTTTLRFVHVGFALALGFLLFPAARRWRHRLMPWDWLLIAAALVVTWYLIWGGDLIGMEPLIDRYVFPEWQDLVVGWVLLLARAGGRRAAPPAPSCRSWPACSCSTASSATSCPRPGSTRATARSG